MDRQSTHKGQVPDALSADEGRVALRSEHISRTTRGAVTPPLAATPQLTVRSLPMYR